MHLCWEQSYTRTHSFFTVHENVNKPKSRAGRRRLFADPYFYHLMWLLSVFSFFFLPKCKYNRINLSYHRLQFVKETQINTVSNIERKVNTVSKHSYGVISGPYFPVFRLNTEIYSVNLRIQSEYRKIRTRNNSRSVNYVDHKILL